MTEKILLWIFFLGLAAGCNVAEQTAVPERAEAVASIPDEKYFRFITSGGQINEDESYHKIRIQRDYSSRNTPQSVFLDLSGTADLSDVLFFVKNGVTLTPNGNVLEVPFEEQEVLVELEIYFDPDSTYENNEIFILSILNELSGGFDVKAHAQYIVGLLNDDDKPSMSFTSASSSVVEGSAHTINLQLSNPSHENVTGVVRLTGGTASASDHNFTDIPVTIPAGSISESFTVTPVADAITELSETLNLQVFPASGLSQADSGQAHELTITESLSAPEFEFNLGAATVAEGATLTVQVDFTGTFESDLYLPLKINDASTAQGGQDFTIPVYVHLPHGDSTATFDIETFDDALYEEDETIVLELEDQSFGTVGGTNPTITVTLTDNEAVPEVSFPLASYLSEEGSYVYIPVELSGPAQDSISVAYTLGGSATEGADYVLGASGTFEIAAGATSSLFPIRLIDDTQFEGTETLAITLTGATFDGLTATPSITPTASTTLSISETNTMPELSFSELEQNVDEGAGTATVSVELDKPSAVDLDFEFRLTGTAAQGSDYTAPATAHTITAGDTSYSFTATLTDDLTDEPAETINLTLLQPGNMTLGSKKTHQIKILDNDAPSEVTSITANNVSVGEGAQEFFEVTLDKASAYDIEIPVVFSGAAEKGADFAVDAESFVIPAGSTTAQIYVSAIDDNIYESATNETIQIELQPGSRYTLGATTASMDIAENDTIPELSWSIPAASPIYALEGSIVNLMMELDHPTYQDVAVTVTVDDTYNAGTCDATCANIFSGAADERDTDLHDQILAGAVTAIIPAGETRAFVHFNVINDDNFPDATPEMDPERFQLIIDSTDDVNAAVVSASDTVATLSLQESYWSMPKLEVYTLVTNINEGETDFFYVALEEPLNYDLTVQIDTTTGTATPGTDYGLSHTTTVTIPAGYPGATVTATAATDLDTPEGAETIILQIVSDITYSITGASSATLTIDDVP